MIEIIIKSYFSIFLGIGLGALFIIVVGLYYIIKHPSLSSSQNKAKSNTIRDKKQVLKPLEDEHNGIAELLALTQPDASSDYDLDDMHAIAGDDVVATKLDLAKAFIETGKRDAAVDILNAVIAQGSHIQKAEAKKLLEN